MNLAWEDTEQRTYGTALDGFGLEIDLGAPAFTGD